MDKLSYTTTLVLHDINAQARFCRERGQIGNANAWDARGAKIKQLDDALHVIALDPKIATWLKKNDPKALAQVLEAIDMESAPAAEPVEMYVKCAENDTDDFTVTALRGEEVLEEYDFANRQRAVAKAKALAKHYDCEWGSNF